MEVKNIKKQFISYMGKNAYIQDKLVLKNISDLVIRAIKGIYSTKNPTKQQIRKQKIRKRKKDMEKN